MTKLLIASNNQGKIQEYREIFAELPFDVTYLDNEGIMLDPEETGITFAENAIIKARAFAEASGLLTLADDSGLEVDALNKEPGVYSARYGGTAKDDHEGRYHLVLTKLATLNISDSARTARFRCVIAISDPAGNTQLAQGAVEGMIAHEPKGNFGFGYDPIFLVPEYHCSMAELEPAIKNKISHRGQAAQAAVPILRSLLSSDNTLL